MSRRVVEQGDGKVRTEEGRIVLVKRRFGPFRRRIVRLFGAQPDLTVRLDALGTSVWGLIDGKRTVGEIHKQLGAQFPDQQDLGPRLGKFMGSMVSRDLVKLR